VPLLFQKCVSPDNGYRSTAHRAVAPYAVNQMGVILFENPVFQALRGTKLPVQLMDLLRGKPGFFRASSAGDGQIREALATRGPSLGRIPAGPPSRKRAKCEGAQRP
jgi:hypothetical protein